VRGFRQERENLCVYSPLILPFPYSRLARRINRALLLRDIRRWMRAARFGRPLVWSFLPTPLARDLIRELDPTLTVYYCIDDFASSSPNAKKITRSEQQLFRDADLVFVTSEKLRERAARLSNRVHWFPFGVSFERFRRAHEAADETPGDFRDLPRPVVGYVGGLHQWVDQDLVVEAARRMPEASFVLVGPPQTDVSKLQACANIHLLGKKSHAELPRYIKGFDVGIVPYGLSPYTANVYPTKLNEYLAMGLPVVTTDLPEIRRFNADHGAVVSVARDAQGFVDAIRSAQPGSAAEIRRRIDVAKLNSWESRIDRMSELIERSLAERRSAPTKWEESLRRAYRKASKPLRRGLAAAAVAAVLLLYSPLAWVLAGALKVDEPVRRSDAVVVFPGGDAQSGAPGPEYYRERIAWAAELLRRGEADYVVVSAESGGVEALASANGIPPDRIVVTHSSSTVQNVEFAQEVLSRHGWTSALLVSSPYHMRRVSMAWKRLAPQTSVIAAPIPSDPFYRHSRWRASWAQVRALAREFGMLAYYKMKGWI
jgi:glycosyltransferase involved in cell wall biosynthesis/uncharacterized SAM-binding protein YcdF (DUF218 family)